jgi:hypothetical protein
MSAATVNRRVAGWSPAHGADFLFQLSLTDDDFSPSLKNVISEKQKKARTPNGTGSSPEWQLEVCLNRDSRFEYEELSSGAVAICGPTVDQLRQDFWGDGARKCDTCKALDFSTLRFGTRRSTLAARSLFCHLSVEGNLWVQDWVRQRRQEWLERFGKRHQMRHLDS